MFYLLKSHHFKFLKWWDCYLVRLYFIRNFCFLKRTRFIFFFFQTTMMDYLLLSKLAPLDQNSIIIGLESTAHYDDNLVRFLISRDFNVCVLNPILTSSMRKNHIRKTKTDKVDTFMIAKTLMMQDSPRFLTLEDLDYIELKELGRFRQKTVKQRTRLKIQLTSYLGQVFSELQYFFKSGIHQNLEK